MTSKTSLFNFGIYKNILKRFKWGSLIYFVIIFFSMPFAMLMGKPGEHIESFKEYYRNYVDWSMSEHLIHEYGDSVLFLAVFVPTVVAVLIFGIVHAGRQGIFTHSLPVKRGAVYVSSLLGGFTLMIAPILGNVLIMIVMNLCGYAPVLSISSIMSWLVMQMFTIFTMFAFACIAGLLTGHGAAHVAVNFILLVIPYLIMLIISLISDRFVYGFVELSGIFETVLMYVSPLIPAIMINRAESIVACFVYIAIAVVIYALGYLLYSKRKVELCGDMAAFKSFRSILKYTVSGASVVCTLGIAWSAEIGTAATYIVVAVISMIVYFACEMLLCKSVKVFGKYKGYIGFAVVTVCILLFCKYTSMFGFETRIPDSDSIAGVTIYQSHLSNDADMVYLDENEAINAVRELHAEVLTDIPLTKSEREFFKTPYSEYTDIVYKLKNGKKLIRRYPLTHEAADKLLDKMFEYPEYKMYVTNLHKVNFENVTYATIEGDVSIGMGDDAKELFAMIKKDVESLSRSQIYEGVPGADIRVAIHISKQDNDRLKVFKDSVFGEFPRPDSFYDFSIGINPHFKNTVQFLKDKGYYGNYISDLAGKLAICKIPFYIDGDTCKYKEDSGKIDEFRISTADCVSLEEDDALQLVKIMMSKNRNERAQGRNYIVYITNNNDDTERRAIEGTFWGENELPGFLKKYVNAE